MSSAPLKSKFHTTSIQKVMLHRLQCMICVSIRKWLPSSVSCWPWWSALFLHLDLLSWPKLRKIWCWVPLKKWFKTSKTSLLIQLRPLSRPRKILSRRRRWRSWSWKRRVYCTRLRLRRLLKLKYSSRRSTRLEVCSLLALEKLDRRSSPKTCAKVTMLTHSYQVTNVCASSDSVTSEGSQMRLRCSRRELCSL